VLAADLLSDLLTCSPGVPHVRLNSGGGTLTDDGWDGSMQE
jgi:hypothetical protein